MSYKFIRTPYTDASPDDFVVTVELGNDNALPDMLEAFQGFLLASGFIFDGNVRIVEKDED